MRVTYAHSSSPEIFSCHFMFCFWCFPICFVSKLVQTKLWRHGVLWGRCRSPVEIVKKGLFWLKRRPARRHGWEEGRKPKSPPSNAIDELLEPPFIGQVIKLPLSLYDRSWTWIIHVMLSWEIMTAFGLRTTNIQPVACRCVPSEWRQPFSCH